VSNRYRIMPNGLVLGPSRELRRAGRGTKVRNVQTGRVLPCNWSDCWKDGDDRIQIVIPHDAPNRAGDTLTYIFCSDDHRRFFAQGTKYERYLT
jgi:hypothetical protein